MPQKNKAANALCRWQPKSNITCIVLYANINKIPCGQEPSIANTIMLQKDFIKRKPPPASGRGYPNIFDATTLKGNDIMLVTKKIRCHDVGGDFNGI